MTGLTNLNRRGVERLTFVADRGLRRGHARDRHAVRGATHVVEPRHVEEVDRVRIAAVLAANAELEVRLVLASDPRGKADQPPHAGLVDRLERASVDDLPL